MNRKLHNTVMALIASSSFFVLGLLTATPVPSPTTAASATATFDPAAVDGSAVRAPAEASPRRSPRRARQHTVAMPFFSFAPRG